MEDAVTITKKQGAHPAKRVSHNADGSTTLITGVTLRSMLVNNFLINVPKDISSQFTADMLGYQLSTRFTIGPDARLQYAEIVGVVPGKTPLVVQVGYQITGEAHQSDLPRLPPTSSVTDVSRSVFNHKLDQINGD